jgi:hypothetical protein
MTDRMDIFEKQLPEHVTRRQIFEIYGVRKKAFRQLGLMPIGTLKHQGNALVYNAKDVRAAVKARSIPSRDMEKADNQYALPSDK